MRYNRDLIAKVQKFYEENPDMLAAEPNAAPAEAAADPDSEQDAASAETAEPDTEAMTEESPEPSSEMAPEEEPASDTSEGGDNS